MNFNTKTLEAWWNEYLDEIMDKSSKGYMRILHNIADKKNEKAVKLATKYLITKEHLDPQIVGFMKPFIVDKLSDWAAETYNDIRMGC